MVSDDIHKQVDALLQSKAKLNIKPTKYKHYLLGFLFGFACIFTLFISSVELLPRINTFFNNYKDYVAPELF